MRNPARTMKPRTLKPSRRRRISRAGALGALGALGAVGALVGVPVAVRARWAAHPDPTGGRPLEVPPGTPLSIPTPDGGVLAAVGSGPESGPVVVLAHGWTADHRVWGPTATRLVAAGRRVVMYDQRGHGASTVGRAGLTIDGLADDLRTVLEYLDARDAVLAGHSMGGMAVQAFALRHPDVLADRVASLVLVSTAADRVAGPGPYRTWAPWLVGRTRVTRAVGSRWAGPFLVRHAVGRRACLAHLAATAETFAATPPSVRAELLSAIVDLDLTGGLTTITTPTVVVSGTRDRLTVHRRSRTIAALIPGARLEVLRGAGHQLVFEAPDRLAELIGGPRPVPAPAGAMP